MKCEDGSEEYYPHDDVSYMKLSLSEYYTSYETDLVKHPAEVTLYFAIPVCPVYPE